MQFNTWFRVTTQTTIVSHRTTKRKATLLVACRRHVFFASDLCLTLQRLPLLLLLRLLSLLVVLQLSCCTTQVAKERKNASSHPFREQSLLCKPSLVRTQFAPHRH